MITKYVLGALTLATLLSCTQKSNRPAQSNAGPIETTDTLLPAKAADSTIQKKTISEKQLITPGKGIGQLQIDATTADAYKILGKPDSGDNAMGSSLAVWYANHNPAGYSTSVFASHKYGAKDENAVYIKKIMVSSPWFKTKEGIGTGSTLAEIEKYFTLKKGDSFKLKGSTIDVYADKPLGITFEIDPVSSKCTSVIVGRPNEGNGTYLNMH